MSGSRSKGGLSDHSNGALPDIKTVLISIDLLKNNY